MKIIVKTERGNFGTGALRIRVGSENGMNSFPLRVLIENPAPAFRALLRAQAPECNLSAAIRGTSNSQVSESERIYRKLESRELRGRGRHTIVHVHPDSSYVVEQNNNACDDQNA